MGLKELKIILGNRIRTLRNSRGWTQERLAEEVNVHATYVSRIESCKKTPTLPIICKIADAFGVDAYELLLDERKASSFDYKKRKLINIVKESGPANIDIYSTLINALHRRYKRKYKQALT